MGPVDQAEERIRCGGHVHLMGIGGIGMAGVAWLLKERGFTVSGCDLRRNRQTEWLARNGILIEAGHAAAHIDSSVSWLVRSTAVPDTHPEVKAALEHGLPVSRRGEVLPALMRARTCIAVSGTHGKTTTTAMIAQLLNCGYCIGGEVGGFEGVARDGEVMVVEADESDGTVAGYTPDYAVITNIDYDHMEHHASESAFAGCFEQLIQNTRRKVYYCSTIRLPVVFVRRIRNVNPFSFRRSRFRWRCRGGIISGTHQRRWRCVETGKPRTSCSLSWKRLSRCVAVLRRFLKAMAFA
jgi:UDP-N-acetylmuramate-alanine ligase